MAKCDTCGNDYHLSFVLVMGGHHYSFDSFECAIHKLAPTCSHCGCRILGHGIESDAAFYCCAHCASQAGVTGAVDNTRGTRGAAAATRAPGP